MVQAAPSLRRLLGTDAGQVLDQVAAAVPGLQLALIGVDGEIAYSTSDWPTGAEHEGGARLLELSPRDEPIGALAVRGAAPEPLLEAVRQSISLLLREVLDRHDLAAETLERYREINLLYRASETIGASLDPGEVPRLLLAETERVIPADAAAVLLGAPEANAGLAPVEVKGSGEGVTLLLSATAELREKVHTTGRPDIATWPAASSDSPLSAMCVPIRAGETVLGTIVLGRSESPKVFTAGDEKLLLGLAGQAGIAIERARLHEQEARRQRLEEELAVARRIQLALLPSHVPVVDGWSFAATYQAARQVGGDFYDFLGHALSQRRMGLVIADVTGKGVPAALMMAYSRAVVRAQSMAGHSPREVLARTNQLIMQERQTRLFLSAFYAELDLDSGRLVYANAGHDAPLLIEAGGRTCRELDAPGVILGAFGDIGLATREAQLAEGDTVIFYTDGVTEARDSEGRLFGDDRLVTAATAAAAGAVGTPGAAQQVLEAVVGAVADFTAGADQADDLTVVVVHREGG